MACFLDETHVLLASIDDKNDPMYERYKIDLEVLKMKLQPMERK